MTLGYQEKIPGRIFDYGGAVFNLQHKDFGGEINGAWDTAFTLAMIALPVTGGTIVIPPSKDVYNFDGVNLALYGKPNMRIIAYGAKLKKNKPKLTSDPRDHMFHDRFGICDGFQWFGGEINLNRSAFFIGNTVSFFFGIRLNNLVFKDFYIYDGIEEGIKLYKPQYFRVANGRIDNCRNDGVQVHNPVVDGFQGNTDLKPDRSTQDGWILDNWITNIDDGTHGALDGQGIAIHGTSPAQVTKNIHVRGNTIVGCIRGILAEFNQPGNPGINLKFDQNIIKESESHGINLTGCQGSSANNNEIYNIGKATTISSETFGIILGGSGDPRGYGNICIGNMIIDDRSPDNLMDYGIIVKQQTFAIVRSNHVIGPKIKSYLVEWGTGKVVQSIVEGEVVPQGLWTRESSGQTIGNAAWTNVEWDTEKFDYSGAWDLTPNPERIYVTSPGQYTILTNVPWPTNAVGFRGIRILKDDGMSSVVWGEDIKNPTTTDDSSQGCRCTIPFTNAEVDAGIWIRVQTYQSSGGDLTPANAERFNISVTYNGGRLQP